MFSSSSCPPVSTGILSVGSHPYCAWHYFIEGSATPLLSDVAYALASKVTSKIVSKTRYSMFGRLSIQVLYFLKFSYPCHCSVDGLDGEEEEVLKLKMSF